MAILEAPPTRLDLPLEEIARLCRKHQVLELAVFGSVLRDDFRPDSDVDFLVRFLNGDPGPWMCHLTELQEELSQLLLRRVDLLDWEAVERSQNPYRRHAILSTQQRIYVA